MEGKKRYPGVTIYLDGGEEAFSILAKAKLALVSHGVPRDEIESFIEKAVSGDFYNMLSTVRDYIFVVEVRRTI